MAEVIINEENGEEILNQQVMGGTIRAYSFPGQQLISLSVENNSGYQSIRISFQETEHLLSELSQHVASE